MEKITKKEFVSELVSGGKWSTVNAGRCPANGLEIVEGAIPEILAGEFDNDIRTVKRANSHKILWSNDSTLSLDDYHSNNSDDCSVKTCWKHGDVLAVFEECKNDYGHGDVTSLYYLMAYHKVN